MKMNELRNFMNIVEADSLNERGGFIDKILSKVGTKSSKSSAGGRVRVQTALNNIKELWNEFRGINNIKKNDSDGFREFLKSNYVDDHTIDSFLGTGDFDVNDALEKAARAAASAGTPPKKGVTGFLGPNAEPVDSSGSIETVHGLLTRELGGDASNAMKLANTLKGDRLKNDSPLSRVGAAYFKVTGSE